MLRLMLSAALATSPAMARADYVSRTWRVCTCVLSSNGKAQEKRTVKVCRRTERKAIKKALQCIVQRERNLQQLAVLACTCPPTMSSCTLDLDEDTCSHGK
jgi:hypothetical protein